MKAISSFILLFLISASSFANKIEFDMSVKFSQGKNETNVSKIVEAEFGEKFKIEKGNIIAEITPSPFSPIGQLAKTDNEMIMLHGKVFEVKDGKKRLISSPQIITILGERSTFSIEEEELKFILKVKANK